MAKKKNRKASHIVAKCKGLVEDGCLQSPRQLLTKPVHLFHLKYERSFSLSNSSQSHVIV